MEAMTAYLDAHPVLWALIGLFVLVTVLRIVAKLACLAVLVIIGLSVVGTVAGILGRVF